MEISGFKVLGFRGKNSQNSASLVKIEDLRFKAQGLEFRV
jgi:hypothetical protein